MTVLAMRTLTLRLRRYTLRVQHSRTVTMDLTIRLHILPLPPQPTPPRLPLMTIRTVHLRTPAIQPRIIIRRLIRPLR